jgi:amino acid adenylation domain-containing protein
LAVTAGSGLSSVKQAALERLLRGDGVVRDPAPIRPRPADAIVPISAEQEHVWLHAGMAADVPLYNEAITIHRRGACDPALLAASFNEVLRRHEIWRTDFQVRGCGIVQRVHGGLSVHLPLIDLTTLPPQERDAAAVRIAAADARLPFDLSQAPLLRGRIVKLGEAEHRLYLTLHHIIFDGVSLYRVLLPTLAAVYADLAAGYSAATAGPKAPALQYGDYVLWRAEQLEGDAVARQLAYWSNTLAGELPEVRLPVDHPPPRLPMHRGGMETFALSAEFTERLKKVSLQLGVTLYCVLLTSFEALLFRYTGQTDLVVGGVADMRRHRALEPLMGYFLNTLPIRTRPASGMSFRDYASQTSAAVLGMLDGCDAPFSRLLRALQPRRYATAHPLFQVLFSIQPPAPQFAEGWDLTQMDVSVGLAKFDLYLELEERPEGLIGRFLYSTDLFEPPTILRMVDHWCTIIEAAAADPDCALRRLPLMTPTEVAQIGSFNDTAHEVPAATLPDLLEAQVARSPAAAALVFGEESVSYAELDARANRLARHLADQGIGPEGLVALALPRSIEMVVALLAVLKSGAAYLPLDPDDPPQRLAFMLTDSGAARLVATSKTLTGLEGMNTTLPLALRLDDPDLQRHLAALPSHALTDAERAAPLNPDNLAYLIYTSGSTGAPKGAANTHVGAVNRLAWMQDALQLSSEDRVLQKTPWTFDVSVWEFLLPLLYGATLVVARPQGHKDPHYLAEIIQAQRITILHFVPSMLAAFLEAAELERCSTVRHIVSSGEALGGTLCNHCLAKLPRAVLWNLYGPTEASIDVTCWCCCAEADNHDSPIGRPIWNTQLYVLDASLSPVPVGVSGELYIAGVGLARGYAGRPGLTAERFLACPFGPPGARMYRTGDLARWRADGTVDFLGRADDQIKIRGFRVEPGEIEAVLLTLPTIAQARVQPRSIAGETRLIAYLVPRSGEALPATPALRQELEARLPNYMVPAAFVGLSALPLTPNGKLDRKQLPPPDQPAPGKVQPVTKTERRLAEIWKDLLGLDEIETTADFFVLGGDSLLAMRLLTIVEAEFGRRISPAALFQSPTIKSLALAVESSEARIPAALVCSLPPVAKPGGAKFDARDATTLRLVRSACGVSRGVVVGMPGLGGHAAGIGVIAANTLQDYDVWTFAVETGGRRLTEDEAWLACAREIADRLMAEDGLSPRAIIGVSFGGFMGWLVERFVVAAGGKATPIINFDGGAQHVRNKDWQERIGRALPAIVPLEATRMLLLHGRLPGKFTLAERPKAEWTQAGVTLERLSYRTIAHHDVILPAAIAAGRDALAAYIETGRVGPARRSDGLDFDTMGGALFRMLDDASPPTAAAVSACVDGKPLPDDGTVYGALLFLAVASGDAEMALELARRIKADAPLFRGATYAEVALLSELGRQNEASAVAEAWCFVHPEGRKMRERAHQARQQSAPWGSVDGLVVGSDPSLDFAATFIPLPLRGHIDYVGADLIAGWAQNPLQPEVPVCLEVVVDGMVVAQTLADCHRPDLLAAGLGSGRHGFSVRVPFALTKRQQQSATVRRPSDHVSLAWTAAPFTA